MSIKKERLVSSLIISIIITFFSFSLFSLTQKREEKSFVFVVPAYNIEPWYQMTLDSIFSQKYQKYKVIFIDDFSEDGTGDLVEQYVNQQHSQHKHRCKIIKNKTRQLQLMNRHNAIHLCDDNDIIFLLDGDDLLPHERVLQMFNEVYQDPNVWIAYGNNKTWCQSCLGRDENGNFFVKRTPSCIHPACHDRGTFTVTINGEKKKIKQPVHPITFYAKLYKKIRLQDLLCKGEPFPIFTQKAIMDFILQMGGPDHLQEIPSILHLYNHSNPLHIVHTNYSSDYRKELNSRPRYPQLTEATLNKKTLVPQVSAIVLLTETTNLNLLKKILLYYQKNNISTCVCYEKFDDEQKNAMLANIENISTVLLPLDSQSLSSQLKIEQFFTDFLLSTNPTHTALIDGSLISSDSYDFNKLFNLSAYCASLDEPHALAFYLRSADDPEHVPPLININNGYKVWQPAFAQGDWRFLYREPAVIYRTREFLQILKIIDATTIDSFKQQWSLLQISSEELGMLKSKV